MISSVLKGDNHLNSNLYAVDLIRHVNNASPITYDTNSLKPIGDPDFKSDVHDTPFKFYLSGDKPAHNAVLIISQEAFPYSVEKAIYNARQIQGQLTPQNAAVILKPRHEGHFQGRSYAIWPEHKPISDFRPLRFLQKRWLQPRVFSWLQSIAKESLVRNLTDQSVDVFFRGPLESLVANQRLSNSIRCSAEKALTDLQTKQWEPATTAQHSDCTLGNILLLNHRVPSPDNGYGFCVIDWGAGLTNGVPAFDMIRYCMSTNVSTSNAKNALVSYAQTLDIDPQELIHYLICALGQIGMNLEQFPETRYLDMCERNVSYVQRFSYA